MTTPWTLQVEKLADLLKGDGHRHFNAHWQEVAKFKDILKLSPFVGKYEAIERDGRLHICTLRQDGNICGYSLHFIVRGHPHYSQLTFAEDDMHYLMPHLRGTGAHFALRCFALKTLKERGVQFVTARTKFGHGHYTVLRKIGFEPLDQVYGMDLTKWESPAE